MKLSNLSVFLVALALAACASPSEPPKTLTIGEAVVESRLDGERVIATLSASRSDERLTVQYERARRRAELIPKYGPIKVLENVELSSDLDELNRRLAEPAASGLDFARERKAGASAGGLKPQTATPPPATCSNPCFDACDNRFSDPVQNEACRFGCNTGCAK